ncbi:isochorismatase family protein [Kushneria phyllosphaerae]|uniref:Streptothricin hydrolase n=1 Tax=Kushneria phyllosphaerae TaxID=2100822 RepID=A0A2R8CHA2_9GAMM|nr:isochorismatase family protein [Kushneria phyllosphaerae]SPJ32277.1 Streptothricin hydrolase [Kushneria phyllosphaerae]
MSATALLLIDVQASFPTRHYWDEMLANAWRPYQRRLLDLAHEAGTPVVRIFHEAPSSEGAFDPSNGLIRPLEGFEDDVAVTFHKTAHNAFTDTGLARWLRLNHIERLIISGIRTEQCCETTARVGSDLGFDIDFVSEATLTFDMQRAGRLWSASDIRAHTELVLEDRFARIVTVDTLVSEWRERSAA